MTNLPAQIAVHEPGLHPEAVGWDATRQRFLISSATRGRITVVDDDGSLRPLTDGRDIKSALGFHLDPKHDRLLVAAADFAAVQNPKVQGDAKLAIYNLTAGTRERLVDLVELRPKDRHLANDVTVDSQGNAYVTDGLSPLIFRVTPRGHASVFLEDPTLDGEGVNLNGIACHPDGYLLVAVGSQRTIYRIPIRAPGKLTEVRLPASIEAGSLAFRSNGNLVAALPFVPGVMELASHDGWRSARIVGRASAVGRATTTSATLREGVIYGLNSRVDETDQNEPVRNFEIWRADLH